jgi:hypothetical protein
MLNNEKLRIDNIKNSQVRIEELTKINSFDSIVSVWKKNSKPNDYSQTKCSVNS